MVVTVASPTHIYIENTKHYQQLKQLSIQDYVALQERIQERIVTAGLEKTPFSRFDMIITYSDLFSNLN